MSKAILVIDMPSCCHECFALDDHYDYPTCLITQEQRGYKFRTREQKMDKCPLKKVPSYFIPLSGRDDYTNGYKDCLDDILGK